MIPGIKIDGKNIFMMRETIKWAKNYCINNGPLFLEVMTYRYHGHSMSDPGLTYRKREDVQKVRQEADCIDYVKNLLLNHKLASEEDLEQINEKTKSIID